MTNADGRRTAETLADWLEEHAGAPVPFERVAPGGERVLPDADARELDALPSRLAG